MAVSAALCGYSPIIPSESQSEPFPMSPSHAISSNNLYDHGHRVQEIVMEPVEAL